MYNAPKPVHKSRSLVIALAFFLILWLFVALWCAAAMGFTYNPLDYVFGWSVLLVTPQHYTISGVLSGTVRLLKQRIAPC